MSIDFGAWTEQSAVAPRQQRELRSGLTGFGARPALHPAWRAPGRPAGGSADGEADSGPTAGSWAD